MARTVVELTGQGAELFSSARHFFSHSGYTGNVMLREGVRTLQWTGIPSRRALKMFFI